MLSLESSEMELAYTLYIIMFNIYLCKDDEVNLTIEESI